MITAPCSAIIRLACAQVREFALYREIASEEFAETSSNGTMVNMITTILVDMLDSFFATLAPLVAANVALGIYAECVQAAINPS